MTEHGPLHEGRTGERPRLEVADIFRAHGEAFRESHVLTSEQRKVMAAIESCRTSVLGGHADLCPECGHVDVAYNSCGNRHCPKCQALPQARWVSQRQQRVLPTHYFHLVFTLPRELREFFLRNRRPCFNLLFQAASSTLLTLSADPKWLGGRLGITSVLHTWTRELHFHPHLHCIVTGGGLSDDGRWIGTKPEFLFPVRVLSALFRGKMLDGVRRLQQEEQLNLPPKITPETFDTLIASLYRRDWVVYCKHPFAGPDAVFAYLGRYTHRVAISNARLIALEQGQVTFATKNGGRAVVSVETFINRFLLHVLPDGFVKIRHYGLLAPHHAKSTLEKARVEIENESTSSEHEEEGQDHQDCQDDQYRQNEKPLYELTWIELMQRLTGRDLSRCPRCGATTIRVALHELEIVPEGLDSS